SRLVGSTRVTDREQTPPAALPLASESRSAPPRWGASSPLSTNVSGQCLGSSASTAAFCHHLAWPFARWRRCSSVEYVEYSPSSRLAIARNPRRHLDALRCGRGTSGCMDCIALELARPRTLAPHLSESLSASCEPSLGLAASAKEKSLAFLRPESHYPFDAGFRQRGPDMLDILLVDDEADIRLPLGEALRELGHRVSLASDGGEAMRCLDHQTFNLVLSDIRLPKVDGFTILRRVRNEQPDTHVVLMTAFGTIQEAVAAVIEAAVEYLTKPFELPEVLAMVERIDERWRLLRELAEVRAELATRKVGQLIEGRSPATSEEATAA